MHFMDHVKSELERLNIQIPDGEDIHPPPPLEVKLDLSIKLPPYSIPLNAMSLQDTVDFVVFLIYITYGRQRFVIGVPTVGGDVNVGYLTRTDGFVLLTERRIKLNLPGI